MNVDQLAPTKCPEHLQLLAFAEGDLEDAAAFALESHLAACDRCDALLASLEEQSDTLVRTLASLPASEDDEASFRKLQVELLAHPEPFSGTATTDAIRQALPLEIVLPFSLGNYELREQIGVGAHGAVFRARHTRLDREVAIKLLLRADGASVDEFTNEMRVVGQLDHPNIVRATDAGEHDGTYFLVMDFVEGLDVSSLLRRVGPLGIAEACELARQTALGLAVAHDHSLVHRDVKASNLLFTVDGGLKLLDLGLATFAAKRGDTVTNPVGPRGTADYMAPEQWAEASQVTPAADLYSLGCTLFKMLTGATPYNPLPAGFRSKQQAHESAEIPSLVALRGEVPAALDALVAALLEKDFQKRPSSARDVAESLERFARGHDLSQLVVELFPNAPRREARKGFPVSRRLALTAGGVAAAALLSTFRPRPAGPNLSRATWRDLQPLDPPVIRLASATATHRRGPSDDEFVLQSDGPALMQFGHPVGTPFQFRATLSPQVGSGCGVFFGLRPIASEASLSLDFFTLEWLPTSAGSGVLRWTQNRFVEGALTTPEPLAETEVGAADGALAFDLVVGQRGFPTIVLNGQAFPATRWVTSKEARPLMTTSARQLAEVYAGRIGVFQHRGQTRCTGVQLMYLDSKG